MNFTMLEKKYASSKTPENKILLNTRAKEYRLVLNANYQKYTEKCSDELRSLSSDIVELDDNLFDMLDIYGSTSKSARI
jgi:hypothetical protein